MSDEIGSSGTKLTTWATNLNRALRLQYRLLGAAMISETFREAGEQLLGRASGPMHIRLLIMPLMATLFALRAAVRDVREGRPPFLWAVITRRLERRQLCLSAWRDIGRVFVVGLVVDTLYQLLFLHAFRPLQAMIVALLFAMLPYILIRGPAARLLRLLQQTRRA